MSESKQGLKSLPRNVWAMSLTSLFNDISSEMLLNLMPLFLFDTLGVRTNLIGLIEGVAETTASVLKIVFGRISDRIGKRKPLAVGGYALSAFAKPLLYFANAWPGVAVVRLLDRTGKGVRTAARDALLADSVEGDNRGLAFGLHRAADTAGAMIGIIIAALVVWLTQRNEALLALGTFRTIILISIIPGALAVVTLLVGARDVRQTTANAEKGAKPAPLSRRFYLFLGIMLLFMLGNSSDAFLVLRAQDAGLSVLGILLMLVAFNLVYTLVSAPAGALSDRVERRKVLIVGWLWYGLLYLGFALARAGWQVVGLYVVYGVYYAFTDGVAKAMVADMVPEAQRGFAYGLFNAAIGLAALPASVIAGLLWQGVGNWTGWGAGAPFLFGAGIALLATLLMTRFRPTPATA